jgi:hypothetical protein
LKLLKFHKESKKDLNAILNFYKIKNVNILNQFKIELSNKIKSIKNSPQLYSKIKGNIRKCKLNKYPFNIIFVEKENIILILAIAHFKRKPYYWKKRI